MEEHALEPDDRVKLVRQRDKFERALRALVKEGIEDGSVVPCDPVPAIFVILGAMNWVPKWFRPSGDWTPSNLTVALSQIFERAIVFHTRRRIAARRRRRAGLGAGKSGEIGFTGQARADLRGGAGRCTNQKNKSWRKTMKKRLAKLRRVFSSSH